MDMEPERWWQGALPAEKLASGAVGATTRALAQLSSARGRRIDVRTSPALIAASFAAVDHLRVSGRPPDGWAPLSGFVQAADGWVRLHANYPHHAAAITRALGVTTKDGLHEVVRSMPAQVVEDAVVAAGGIAVVVRTEDEWLAHPHARATAADPWLTVEPGTSRGALRPADEPLSGIRVLDLTRVIAGPSCTQVLACLGADVLRIDPPGRPELLDQYLSNGMGKRSAEVDLELDLDTVRSDLLPAADIVVVGYRPQALARFGLDPATLHDERPDLVIGSLSAWGEHGPWGTRAGFDSIVQAATGIAAVQAGPDGRPGALPVQALDHSTGYALAAALIDLLTLQQGGVVRANLLGAARSLLGMPRVEQAETVALDLPIRAVDSPYGELTVTPLPFTVDRQTVVRSVSGYGAATPVFAPAAAEREASCT
jgi:crotonobetainyl-CoA:carnitine CoA-transferase CaiB-like acyl-CoA transferase